MISLSLLAVGLYGVINLDQQFDPNIFIPKDSYVKGYLDSYQENFPNLGIDSGYIYIGELSCGSTKQQL